jgi:MFS family permease
MYTLSVLFIVLMPITGTISIKGRGALADVKEGLLYVRKEINLLLLLVLTFFTVLCSTPYMTLLPVFTESILKVGAEGMGVLISVSGIGALAASLVLASLPNKRRGLMLMVGSGILGLALIGFSFSTVWAVSLIMIVFVGLGQAVRMTLANTLLQYYVADEFRGRVMSLYMMEFGLTSIGVFIASVMADQIGVQWSVGGLAIALVAFSLLALALVPRIRKLD